MTVTVDLPDELVIGAANYAQDKNLPLSKIVEEQLRNVVKKYSEQQKNGAKIKSFADCFGTIPDLKLDLDSLRGRNAVKF